MKKLYIILAILSGVLFGSSGIFVRTLTQNGIDATTLLFLRFSIAIIIILLAILISDRSLIKVRLPDLALFLVTAMSIICLNLCYNTSMNLISLSIAAVLLSSAPIFVIVFAYFLFGERITPTKVICVILVIAGCTLTTGILEGNGASLSTFGILGGIGAAVFWAIYTLASKKAIENGKHTYTILLYSLIMITIILIPFTDFSQITAFVNVNTVSNTIFLILHSTFSFALPYIFLTLALNHIESGTASIFTSGSEPLAALIFGMIFYTEIPTPLMFLGMMITIFALVILTNNYKLKRQN